MAKIGWLVDLIRHFFLTDIRSVRKSVGDDLIFPKVLFLIDGGFFFAVMLGDVLRSFLLLM